MKTIPTILVEQIDTAAILKALKTGKPVEWQCTGQERKCVQLAAYRLGNRLRIRADASGKGFSFQIVGSVKKRVKK